MLFSDLGLSRRLESAEGHAAVQFADARRHLFPESGAEWIGCAGAYAVFDGIDSPITQTFGIGLFEELTSAALDTIERFFLNRGAQVLHEVSPFAGVRALNMLCVRQYRPIEISNVMYRPIENPAAEVRDGGIKVRVAGPHEAQVWAAVAAKGWSHEHPELHDFVLQMGAISAARPLSPCFLAELNDKPGAAGSICIYEGVALFAGAATVPEMRRRGLQGALLQARMQYAVDQGCDLAMMVVESGSESQRNAERHGFRVAYTRMKWRASSHGHTDDVTSNQTGFGSGDHPLGFPSPFIIDKPPK